MIFIERIIYRILKAGLDEMIAKPEPDHGGVKAHVRFGVCIEILQDR